MPKAINGGLPLLSYGDAMVDRPSRRAAGRKDPLQAASESGSAADQKKAPDGAGGIKKQGWRRC